MIPGENDDADETRRLCDWVVDHLGDSVPIHFTAFHPDFKLTDKPRTPAATLARAREIAKSSGIKFAYVGNVHNTDGQTTYCPSCGAAVIRRSWHEILANNLRAGCCPCGGRIPGVFPAAQASDMRALRRLRRL
jgi:pyruvate formate lyase activating enzyme